MWLRSPSVLFFFLLSLASDVTYGVSTESCYGYECLKLYVDREEPSYSWSYSGETLTVADPEGTGSGWTGHYLSFTSQEWLTEEDHSAPLWWHTLLIIVPDQLENSDVGFLWITDGDNKQDDNNLKPDLTNYNVLLAADLAVATGTITACLFQIPNGPITFSSDPSGKARYGDDAIAFTWRHFFDDPTSDTDWVMQLPMTKAAVKAMDTVQLFLSGPEGQQIGVYPDHFLVSGASKRGWVAWLAAAVDPRVMGIAPLVMDELNFKENIQHHWRAYGGWTFALKDYWRMNLTVEFGSPKMEDMLNLIDPFFFKEKIILPKLVCSTAGDEFFLLDNTRYWWNKMPQYREMNQFILLPNTEHLVFLGIGEILPAAATWAREIIGAHKRLSAEYGGQRPIPATIEERNLASEELVSLSRVPRFNWTVQPVSGDILVQAETQPSSVHLWKAKTCTTERRDFRLINMDDPCTCGLHVEGLPLGASCINLAVLWTATELEETYPGSKTWLAHVDPDPMGHWTAFFVDLQFPGGEQKRGTKTDWPVLSENTFQFTTSVSIVPETFPAEDCSGWECYGDLV